jgi:hypothetical protein
VLFYTDKKFLHEHFDCGKYRNCSTPLTRERDRH